MKSVIYYSTPKTITSARKTAGLAVAIVFSISTIVSAQLPLHALANTYPITFPITDPVVIPENPITAPITPPVETPTPTSVPSQNGNNGNSNSGSNNNQSSHSNGNVCNDQVPAAPQLFQIKTTNTTAVLSFSPVAQASGYAVSYGTKLGQLQYGMTMSAPSQKGSVGVTIGSLRKNTTYYFSVKAFHGCKTGAFSNTLKATTTASPFAKPRTTTAWEQMRKVVLSWLR